MKEAAVKILLFLLFFNIAMIIFPEGKTQKYCKIVIKLFVLIYIINNILLNSAISLNDLIKFDNYNYSNIGSREISLSESNMELILLLNEELYKGEEVVEDIILIFSDEAQLKALVETKKFLNYEDKENLIDEISQIFNIVRSNIVIR